MTTSSKSKRPTPTQVRAARRMRQRRKKRFVRIGGFTLLAVVSFAFIAGLFLPSITGLGGGGHAGGGGVFGGGAPDGPGILIPDAGREHINLGQAHTEYKSVPPTSGPHYGQPLAPTRWGVHEEQIEDEVLIHNLEHGGIGIFYDCPDGCDDIVQELTALVERGTDGGLKIILSPYAGMQNRISLAAWNFLDQFDEYDDGRVQAFINAHESSPNSPEQFAR